MQTITTLRCGISASLICGCILLLLTAALPAPATAEEVILDEPTPPGQIPPPQNTAPAEPYRPYGTSQGVSPQSGEVPISCEEFEPAYNKAGKPRIVLFLNRYITDNLREWESSTRIHFSYQSEAHVNSGGKKTDATAQGQANAAVQHKAEDGSGAAWPAEYEWQLEEALAQPLVTCGVHLVDRAQAVRLAGANEDPIGQEITSSKYIETQALRGYADLVAQIQCGSTGGEQVFRLKIVEVDTGRILVARTIAGGEFGWVATSRGYERMKNPPADAMGRRLAQTLMTSLAGVL